MKIVIAKSLLEPVGISWFVPVDLLAYIEDDLQEFFDSLVATGVVGNSTDICRILRARAMSAGAEVVVAERWKLRQGCSQDYKDIGIRHIVTIAVPTSTGSSSSVMYLDTYF